jgi:hypothetical protein
MSEEVVSSIALPPTPPEIVEWIREVEGRAREFEQLEVKTEHLLHAGMYARTVHLPAMGHFTNVLIKIPTLLVVSGYCYMLAGGKWARLTGYNVFAASAGRKQICITKEPTDVTMFFATDAKTVEEAEAEFTDEACDLLSRKQPECNVAVVTEVAGCLE